MIGLIGKKREMTQLFAKDGTVVPVTLVETQPCVVTQIKTVEKDGYSAVQLGYGENRNVTQPLKGHLKRAKLKDIKILMEFRISNPENYSEGQKIDSEIFEEGEIIDVSGCSKGKGFQGVVRRYGYSGGPKTHGSTSHRVPGSVGASATPARVVKGKKLPGRMGGDTVTVRNAKIAKIEKEKSIIAIKGAIPGSRNSIVVLQKKTEKKR
jgi:large subunit ribosomal protein L3